MRRGSLIQRYACLVHLGILLTQMLQKEQGFRLKDVKFYCSLVAKWISFDAATQDFAIELMQIKRLLLSLEEKNWVELRVTDKKKFYHLNRTGFLALLESFRLQTELTSMEEALLLFYALKTYQPQLLAYLLPEGSESEDAAHVRALVHPDWFIEDHIRKLDKRIRQIQIRIEENQAMSRFIQASLDAGESFEATLARVGRKFSLRDPYAQTQELDHRNGILFTALRDIYEQRRHYLLQHLDQQRTRLKDRPHTQNSVWESAESVPL